MTFLRSLVRAATPVGLLDLRRAWQSRRSQKNNTSSTLELRQAEFHQRRRIKIDLVSNIAERPQTAADQYEGVIKYLVEQGIHEHHVRDGSIPYRSLEFINETVLAKLESNEPILVLHIGNFVGVSLAFITDKVAKINSQSIVVAIDPNIPHRAIDNPQSYVMKLLCSCGLQRNVIPITGYSNEKNISSDGVIFENYDPVRSYLAEASCEQVLANLRCLFEARFDVVCLDGNHQADYLKREIESILPLMKTNGWMILDDVDSAWVEIQDIFKSIRKWGLEPIATDGRVGIARIANG